MNISLIKTMPPVDLCESYRTLLVETCSPKTGDGLQSRLPVDKLELLACLNTSDGLQEQVQRHVPDLLILSVDFLDAATLSQLIQLNETAPLPVVVFAARHAPEILNIVLSAEISLYTVGEVAAENLPIIPDMAVAQFARLENLRNELQQTTAKLAERKLIERAKGFIMKQKKLSEAQAYAQIRKSAMDQGKSMADLSKRIISVFEMVD